MFRLFKKTKILITGSRGRIGQILTRAFSNFVDIYGLDIKEGDGEKYFRADISNYEELDKTFAEIGRVDCIVHLAADAKVNASWEREIFMNAQRNTE
jgi:nucleoside-diphosphate-sugar epimerase